MFLISFHLFLDLFQLLIPKLEHILLLFNLLDGFLEVALDLIKSHKLLLDLVLLSGNFLVLFHELGILLGEVLEVSLEFADLAFGCEALGFVVDDLIFC